jgi:hypothetical protein
MSATTTNRAYPYLELTDMPDIAGGLENLADAVDVDAQSIADDVSANTSTIATHTAKLAKLGSALPIYHAYASAAGSVTAGVFANVAVDTADIDTDGMHTSSSHAVIKHDGYYLVSGTIGFGTTTTAVRSESMLATTAAPTTTGIIRGTGDSQMTSTSIPTVGHMNATPIHLTAGTPVWVMAFVNASGNFNTSAASPVFTSLSIVCISLD